MSIEENKNILQSQHMQNRFEKRTIIPYFLFFKHDTVFFSSEYCEFAKLLLAK